MEKHTIARGDCSWRAPKIGLWRVGLVREAMDHFICSYVDLRSRRRVDLPCDDRPHQHNPKTLARVCTAAYLHLKCQIAIAWYQTSKPEASER